MKEFCKKYWILIVMELIVIYIYWLFSPINNVSKFSIFISPEILATVLVGIGAIYSWFINRNDREYEKNLQMLKDIDDIREYYKGKGGEPQIVKECVGHLDSLKKNSRFENTFLRTYSDYVEEKLGLQEDENQQFGERNDFPQNERDSKMFPKDNSTLTDIKTKIKNHYKLSSIRNIKYSKNYPEASDRGSFIWTTWYSINESFIQKLDDDIVFMTFVDDQFKAVKLTSQNLKKLTMEMRPRNKKSGDSQFDFYITQLENGNFYENRNNIDLSPYNIEELDLTFLNLS
ncbi:hypothetical protein JN538_09265 [Streptococcus suis]|uniref:hypothetical protein n=1 Tax=Streptococcus suis TaxID=1307 RepID=UPI00195FEF53|nr:hypothetical protein [Streptococcus suis]MBM7321273.1 hypothetical protein [Streptococcus suis]